VENFNTEICPQNRHLGLKSFFWLAIIYIHLELKNISFELKVQKGLYTALLN